MNGMDHGNAWFIRGLIVGNVVFIMLWLDALVQIDEWNDGLNFICGCANMAHVEMKEICPVKYQAEITKD